MSAPLARAVAVPAPTVSALDALVGPTGAEHPPEPGASAFEGWFASSMDLLSGLRVQALRIDPCDALWRELFPA